MAEKCGFCGGKPGKGILDGRRNLHCQSCFEPICDTCAVYGYDGLFRCKECYFKQQEDCEENCRGVNFGAENNHCDQCNFPKSS